MNKERRPSLFLTHFAAVLFIVIFLSGMTEFICLAAYEHQNNYPEIVAATNLFSKKTIQQTADRIAQPSVSSIYDGDQNVDIINQP